ncbi:MAG: class I adenylate-forming enzyme family protein, partial [Planktomarina sp.]|nr:class I adenylate-forming enzyme family protein [Planktomarina sp.]
MMSNQHPSNWTLDHAILQNAAKNPDKIAIIFENENITYSELDKKVKKTVIWMRRHLKKGDKFACLSMNHPNYFVLLLAAAQIGVTMVALNWRLSNKELDYQICDSAPRMVIFGSEFNKKVREIIPSKSNIQLTSIEVIGDSDGLSLSDQMALKKLSEPT